MIKSIITDVDNPSYDSIDEVIEKLNYYRELSNIGLHKLTAGEFLALKEDAKEFFNMTGALTRQVDSVKLFRVTNNKFLFKGLKQKVEKVSQLIGPPNHLTTYGRCNLPGESVFYAALDVDTAMWETQPQLGDYVTVGIWKLKDGHHLNCNSIFNPNVPVVSDDNSPHEYYKAGKDYFKTPQGKILNELFQFFNAEFTKRVKGDEKENYLFSSLLSSLYLQQDRSGKLGAPTDAITYPSTRTNYTTTNFAILNSIVLDKLELEKIMIFSVREMNYTPGTKHCTVSSSFVYEVESFDYVNDRIIYNSAKERMLSAVTNRSYVWF